MKNIILLAICFWVNTVAGQTPDALFNIAIGQNLEIKVLENEYLAALEKAPQVSQLPDPEFGLGAFPFPVETRLGPQVARVSGTQMFPWGGSLKNRSELELVKAEAVRQKVGIKELELKYAIEKAYLKLYTIEKSRTILQRNTEILNSLERLALAKIASGKAATADALRVQLKKNELEQELEVLTTNKVNPTAEINQLLQRDLTIPILIEEELGFSKLDFQKDSLLNLIRETHPLFKNLDYQKEVSRKALKVNDLSQKPSFGLGLDYILVTPRNDADPKRNGRDILQVRGAIKVPLNKKKYRAKEREEALKTASFDYQKEAAISRFEMIIEKAFAEHETARLQTDLYTRQKEITQSVINILESKYSASGGNFDELLRLESDMIDYDLKLLKAIVKSHLAKAEIEKFLKT